MDQAGRPLETSGAAGVQTRANLMGHSRSKDKRANGINSASEHDPESFRQDHAPPRKRGAQSMSLKRLPLALFDQRAAAFFQRQKGLIARNCRQNVVIVPRA